MKYKRSYIVIIVEPIAELESCFRKMSLADVAEVKVHEHLVDDPVVGLDSYDTEAQTGHPDREEGGDPDSVTTRQRPHRTAKFTEKGLEYHRTTWLNNRDAIHKRLQRRGKEVENMIPTSSIKGIEEALARFEDTAKIFQDTHNKCREVMPQELLAADNEWFDSVDQDIFHVRHQGVSALRCLKDEFDKKSIKSNESSRLSKSSRSSKTFHRSKASSRSSVRDQMVKERLRLAELEAETEFVDEKVNMDIINHRIKLAKTRARMEVLVQLQNDEEEEEIEHKPKSQQGDEDHTNSKKSGDAKDQQTKGVIMTNHDEHSKILTPPSNTNEASNKREPDNSTCKEKANVQQALQPAFSDLLVKLVKQQSAPIIDIETFDGDPMKVDYFIAVFKEVVESNIDDQKGRLLRLLKYTKGEARETIRHCVQLSAETCYDTAINLLRKRFGDRHLILSTYRKELRNWQPLRYNDASAFRTFLNFVVKCQSFICDDWSVLDTPDTICMLASKLPPALIDLWNRKAMMHRKSKLGEPRLAEFAKFLEEETTLINDPLYSREALKQIVGYKEKPPPISEATETTLVASKLL